MILNENFPQITSDTKPQIQEPQRASNKINITKEKQATPKHIIYKPQKIKDKNIYIERSQRKNNTHA